MFLNPSLVRLRLFFREIFEDNFDLDTSKHGTRVTPETPLVLKASPKAQWPLQRFLKDPQVEKRNAVFVD